MSTWQPRTNIEDENITLIALEHRSSIKGGTNKNSGVREDVKPCGSKERLFQLWEILGSCNLWDSKELGFGARYCYDLDKAQRKIEELLIANYELNMYILAMQYLRQM